MLHVVQYSTQNKISMSMSSYNSCDFFSESHCIIAKLGHKVQNNKTRTKHRIPTYNGSNNETTTTEPPPKNGQQAKLLGLSPAGKGLTSWLSCV